MSKLTQSTKVWRRPRTRTDIERISPDSVVYGYAKAARLIAKDPEKTGAIYRRFDKLSARNLLYLEALLAYLERQQAIYDEQDGRSIDDEKSYDMRASAESYEYFRDHADGVDFSEGPARKELEKRIKLARDIKEALKDYQEALSLNSIILNLPKPRKHTLKACRTMLEPNGIPDLQGVSRKRLKDKNDLCALRDSEIKDPISSFLMDRFPLLFTVKTTGTDVLFTSSKRLAGFVSVLAAALAFGLLFGAIEALHLQKQKDHGKRLGVLAGFVLAFAFCVMLFTGAKRTDTFAATAAYAAVLVVYVSGPGSND